MAISDDVTHQILMKFLDKKVRNAEEEIATKGTLSEEHAIPLLLKTHFNHIVHLDAEITELRQMMDKRFKEVDKRFKEIDTRFNNRFNEVDKRISKTFTGLTVGFTILGFLIILFGFLK